MAQDKVDGEHRHVMLQYDDGSEEHKEGYYIVVGDGELGPLTHEELREVTNGCVTEFGYGGTF